MKRIILLAGIATTLFCTGSINVNGAPMFRVFVGKTAAPSLVGKWLVKDVIAEHEEMQVPHKQVIESVQAQHMVYEFLKDGKIVMRSKSGVVEGKYVIKANIVEITETKSGTKEVFKIEKMANKQLILRSENAKMNMVFEKI